MWFSFLSYKKLSLSSGYLRLTDFGISRFLGADNSGETSGTPGYLGRLIN